MTRLLLTSSACLALVACASPTYVTQHGLRVYDRSGKAVPAPALEAMTDRVLEVIGGADQLDGVAVYLIPEMIEIPQEDDRVIRTDGYTNIFDNAVMGSVFSGCIDASGLVHELAHLVHDKPRGIPDWTHDDAAFWEKVEGMEEVMKEACTPEQLQAEEKARRDPLAPAPAPPTDAP